MKLEQKLASMNLDELTGLKKDFSRIMEMCVEYKVSVSYFHTALNELIEKNGYDNSHPPLSSSSVKKKITRKRPTKRKVRTKAAARTSKSNIDPADIVLDTFRDFRERNKGAGRASFDSLVSEVRVDLTKAGFELPNPSYSSVSPLAGFIANVLYTEAERKKYGDNDKTRSHGFIENPVKAKDLRDLLRIDFPEAVFDHIVGNIPDDYSKRFYVYDPKQNKIVFRDESGAMHANPNIESTICWEGEEKEKTRESLNYRVSNLILQKRLKNIQIIESEIQQAEKDKGLLVKRKEEFEKRKNKLGGSTFNEIAYTFSTTTAEKRRGVREKLIHELAGNQTITKKQRVSGNDIVDGLNFKEITSKEGAYILEVRVSSTRAMKKLTDAWDTITAHMSRRRYIGVRENFGEVRRQLAQNERELSDAISEIRGLSNKINKSDSKINTLKNKISSFKQISYLGLEGPNFGSYIPLANLIRKEEKYNIKGVFVEYDYRLYNLMKSIMKNLKDTKDKDPRFFDGAEIARRNIDEWILLDFVRSPEVNIASGGYGGIVEFKDEKIALEDYQVLQTLIDEGGSLEEVRGLTEISPEFYNTIKNKLSEKFDVVFLDYIGELTERREQIIRQLAKKRLSNNSVLAITARKRFDMKKDVLRTIGEILQEEGYRIDFSEIPLKDRDTSMQFCLYCCKKE